MQATKHQYQQSGRYAKLCLKTDPEKHHTITYRCVDQVLKVRHQKYSEFIYLIFFDFFPVHKQPRNEIADKPSLELEHDSKRIG
jgi:hypothetical protein